MGNSVIYHPVKLAIVLESHRFVFVNNSLRQKDHPTSPLIPQTLNFTNSVRGFFYGTFNSLTATPLLLLFFSLYFHRSENSACRTSNRKIINFHVISVSFNRYYPLWFSLRLREANKYKIKTAATWIYGSCRLNLLIFFHTLRLIRRSIFQVFFRLETFSFENVE